MIVCYLISLIASNLCKHLGFYSMQKSSTGFLLLTVPLQSSKPYLPTIPLLTTYSRSTNHYLQTIIFSPPIPLYPTNPTSPPPHPRGAPALLKKNVDNAWTSVEGGCHDFFAPFSRNNIICVCGFVIFPAVCMVNYIFFIFTILVHPYCILKCTYSRNWLCVEPNFYEWRLSTTYPGKSFTISLEIYNGWAE